MVLAAVGVRGAGLAVSTVGDRYYGSLAGMAVLVLLTELPSATRTQVLDIVVATATDVAGLRSQDVASFRLIVRCLLRS